MRLCLLLIAMFGCMASALAQPKASVSYATFFGESGPYVEVYIITERSSLRPVVGAQPSANFTLLFKRGEDIVAADKVRLIAPASDTMSNFVQALRYPLANGTYTLELEGTDVADEQQLTLKLATTIDIAYDADELSLSDIQLSTQVKGDTLNNPLARGGAVLEPLRDNFIRRSMTGFSSYVEAYVPPDMQGQPLLLEYTLVRLGQSTEEHEDLMRKTKRFAAEELVTPFLIRFNTNELASGNYALRMVIRDRSLQEFGGRASIFTVANPGRDADLLSTPRQEYEQSFAHSITEDSLEYVLRAIIPVLSGPETEYVNEVIANANPDAMRLAIFNHFYGESADHPAVAYNAYMKVAREVDYHFQSGFGRGFQTDRGHIFLKYGLPDDRVQVNNDPSAPPYEIWVYNFVERTGQSPGKFLFYNNTLDNASYTLLHSTVRGEVFEPQWRRYLYSRSASEFIDEDSAQGTDIQDNVGRYADAYFSDF